MFSCKTFYYPLQSYIYILSHKHKESCKLSQNEFFNFTSDVNAPELSFKCPRKGYEYLCNGIIIGFHVYVTNKFFLSVFYFVIVVDIDCCVIINKTV